MKSIILAALGLSSTQTLAELKPVKSGVYRWADHTVTTSEDRESRKILEGTSAHLDYLEIHATTQFVGAKPSKAHANEDIEELIIIKDGLAKFTIEDKSKIMGAGSVVSLMPQQMHSIENAGDVPLTYFVMRYRSKKPMDIKRGVAEGGSLMLDINSLPLKPSERGGGRPYFDRPTAMCDRFEMHVTQLHRKGPSHKPHQHIETEIILVISGDTEMMIDGKNYTAGSGDFYFAESQLMHGISNATDKPATYFAYKWN